MDPFRQLASQGAMIEQLASDSRRCAPGVAFFAYPGTGSDGRAFISDALARGASAVLWDDTGFAWRAEWRAPNLPVRDLKNQAGELANAFYGRPSERMWVCGVTGTNGKTTCSQWLAHLLATRCPGAGVIGTLGWGLAGKPLEENLNTTPDALELQRMLAQFKRSGAQAVAMEVSSHGLAQGRVNGVRFDCALFTNLSHDHLDYHGTLEAYAEAKARLFDAPGLETAVLNLDDALGARLAERLDGRVRTVGYGFSSAPAVAVDDYLPASLIPAQHTGQLARFNVANALGVLGGLLAYGVPRDEALALLKELPAVPGRMQKIGERPLVVVDYAHTPDALEKVLAALRPAAQARGGKLAVVFGAGGNRDAAKRPLMGAAAARHADRVLITSDNPRGEDPLAIIAQIQAGIAGTSFQAEADRAAAIGRAIREAGAQDVILIAGKGHEATQEIAGRKLPFSDAAVARQALGERGDR